MRRTCKRVKVSGRVQGVFFRAWPRDEAIRRGLSGWVRNCSDGSVEALVCGPETAVADLLSALRSGPPRAEVTDVVSEPAPAFDGQGFEIRR